MTDIDLGKVKRNVATMVSKSAPEADIDRYISESGTTIDAVKGFKVPPTPSEEKTPTGFSKEELPEPRRQGEDSFDYLRRNTYVGNMVTGAEQSGVDLMRGSRWLGEKLYGANPHDTAEKNAFDTTDKKLKTQEGAGVGNWLARQAGDPFNYMLADIGGKPAAKVAGKAVKSTVEALEPKNEKFIYDLIAPKPTKSVKEAQVGRTTEKGILKSKVVAPTARDKEIAAEIAKLPVSKYKSLQANYAVVRDANLQEAKNLEALLKKHDVVVPFDDVQSVINESVKKISTNTYLGAQGKLAARRAAANLNTAILNNVSANGEITASGLLKARKEFDTMALKERPKTFSPDAAMSAGREAVYDLRQSLNSLIEARMPNAQYKTSLRRQNNLYMAMENIEEKAAQEPGNMVSRFAQSPTGKTLGIGAAGYGGYELFNNLLRKISQ